MRLCCDEHVARHGGACAEARAVCSEACPRPRPAATRRLYRADPDAAAVAVDLAGTYDAVLEDGSVGTVTIAHEGGSAYRAALGGVQRHAAPATVKLVVDGLAVIAPAEGRAAKAQK